MLNFTEFTSLNENLQSTVFPDKRRTETPFIFTYTLYRIPTDEELKKFEEWPELTPDIK